ncbi:hypothetical protein MUU72_26210 [Streptomyces sp. RS10V-4]|uniref:hypothetical protein n=1 Tax=Streptomyces rhizoryzae TaxID=2932493 RepID=UPI002004A606|nr:hypothetical protein [Streptomyces rhizoryzae]MCK7626553.1 hypothetical protein [Streptomyces rhizoryzae]
MPELDPCHTDAKQRVTDPLRSYGWTLVRNLGPLVCARGRERYAHLHSAIGFGLGRHFGGHFGIEVER